MDKVNKLFKMWNFCLIIPGSNLDSLKWHEEKASCRDNDTLTINLRIRWHKEEQNFWQKKWSWMAFFLVSWSPMDPTIWRWKIAQIASTSRAPAGVWVGLCWKIFRLLPLPFKMIFDNSDALRFGYNLPMLFMLIAFPTNQPKVFLSIPVLRIFSFTKIDFYHFTKNDKQFLFCFLSKIKVPEKCLIKTIREVFAFEES